MKKLKIFLTLVIVAILSIISTGVYAYGSQVDTENKIAMPTTLNNGKGTISTELTEEISYQFVEISKEKYEKIKKYEEMCTIINAYIKSDSNYETLIASYEQKYNETANSIMNTYNIQFNEEGLAAIKNLWINEITTYNESEWIKATGKEVSMDLTTFTGEKYIITWVKVGEVYDAQVYLVSGNKEDKKEENVIKNDVPDNNISDKNEIKNVDTTKATKIMPKTGLSNILLISIVIVAIVTAITYIKYRKIK